MAQLYLPADHTDADLVLAGQVAEWIESAELHVAWTADHGHAMPEIAAELREPAAHWTTLAVRAVRELWAALRHQPTPGAYAPLRAAAARETAA